MEGGGETLQTPNELPSTHIRGEKHETNNYEFRWRDKDDKIPNTDGTNKQPNEKRLKKKWSFFFLALNMFVLKVDVKLLNLGII